MKPAVVPAESSPWQIKDVPLVEVVNCASVAAGCSVRISRVRGSGWRTLWRVRLAWDLSFKFVKVTSFCFAV